MDGSLEKITAIAEAVATGTEEKETFLKGENEKCCRVKSWFWVLRMEEKKNGMRSSVPSST